MPGSPTVNERRARRGCTVPYGETRAAVLAFLAKHGPATGFQIADGTRLPQPAVKTWLNRVDGVDVTRCGLDPRKIGRPAWLWRILGPGETIGRGGVRSHVTLTPMIRQMETLAAFVASVREVLAAAEAEHRRAVDAVKAWAGANTEPPVKDVGNARTGREGRTCG